MRVPGLSFVRLNSMTAHALPTVEILQAEATRFAERLAPRAGTATLITLSGELGAGKTTFTQALARSLGVTEPVTSPTFVLEKVYELPESAAFSTLVHIDAYRLEGDRSLEPLDFTTLMQDPGTLILLEWPEMVATQLPAPAARLRLEVAGEGRTISYA